jgi:glycosidase
MIDNPVLYQINTRVWLTGLSSKLGRKATLDDIHDNDLDEFADMGFNWLWLLSVWQTGPAGQLISRTNKEWRIEFEHTLSDLKEEDIAGSGFAIRDYSVHDELGGAAALARLRERLRRRGLKLLLDLVPNHTALDHPWVRSHPEYYMAGTESDLESTPLNYTRLKGKTKDLILAHGRDPYFPGWPDTLQLDYSNPALQEAQISELVKIAEQCDGVRCDMAMLLLPEVFQRTWGKPCQAFWPEATRRVRAMWPQFVFLAEVYWDMEWTLQQQGFDYTYYKRLYDRLRDRKAEPVKAHLRASIDYQSKMARFLENHDEPRAASVYSLETHKAAAVLTFLAPGLRFFHQGQFEGKKKRISPHLIRGPEEPINSELQQFYKQLLQILRQPSLHHGQWQLLECAPAWDDNWTSSCVICFAWQGTKHETRDESCDKDERDERYVVVVNYAANQSQCYIRWPWSDGAESDWRLKDELGTADYKRNGSDLISCGLFLDVPPWQTHVFCLSRINCEEGAESSALKTSAAL